MLHAIYYYYIVTYTQSHWSVFIYIPFSAIYNIYNVMDVKMYLYIPHHNIWQMQKYFLTCVVMLLALYEAKPIGSIECLFMACLQEFAYVNVTCYLLLLHSYIHTTTLVSLLYIPFSAIYNIYNVMDVKMYLYIPHPPSYNAQ